MSQTVLRPEAPSAALVGSPDRPGLAGWITTVDHKRIAKLTLGTALVMLFVIGALALVMRSQLAVPGNHVVGTSLYNEIMTLHGSGMIFLVITPLAIGMGVFLVPLQVGAPVIAAPRVCLTGFWMYAAGVVTFVVSAVVRGPPSDGWYAYTPLSDSQFSPGPGMDLWIMASMLAVSAMILMAGCVLWTALRMRAPGMTLLRMPVFTWSMVATCMMTITAFPALLASMGLISAGRVDPSLFTHNVWNIGYQYIFWFYGHPVVYVMFFPFVGSVAEVIATFSERKYFGYTITVGALLTFAGLSMAVFGHHMYTTGQAVDDYYNLTSTLLAVPAGIEYFGSIATMIGGRLRYSTAMRFAIAFLPQFLIGGLSGIMLASPVLDHMFHGSYFVVAHFPYTLFAGSVFGFFAGFYFWFPKVTGLMLDERLGKLHLWLMVVGTNVTFLPMFGLGFLGMSRRVATYTAGSGFSTLNLISSCGAGVIAVSMMVLAVNVGETLRRRRRLAPPDPWGGQTLEWATSSPPPPFNFNRQYPIPPITSYTPLLDLRWAVADAERATGDGAPSDGSGATAGAAT